MQKLKFVIAGNQSDLVAAALIQAFGLEAVEAHCQHVDEALEAERKAVDPISLAALILSIPSAVLAVIDIVDRLKKRRTAQAVIDAAKKAKTEHQVDIYLLAVDQMAEPVAGMTPDQLLDLASALQSPSGKATGRN